MCMSSSRPAPPPPPPPPAPPPVLEQEVPKKPKAKKSDLNNKQSGNKDHRSNYSPTAGAHLTSVAPPTLNGIPKK